MKHNPPGCDLFERRPFNQIWGRAVVLKIRYLVHKFLYLYTWFWTIPAVYSLFLFMGSKFFPNKNDWISIRNSESFQTKEEKKKKRKITSPTQRLCFSRSAPFSGYKNLISTKLLFRAILFLIHNTYLPTKIIEFINKMYQKARFIHKKCKTPGF